MTDTAVGIGGFPITEDKMISNEFNLYTPPKYYKDISNIQSLVVYPHGQPGVYGVPYQVICQPPQLLGVKFKLMWF